MSDAPLGESKPSRKTQPVGEHQCVCISHCNEIHAGITSNIVKTDMEHAE